MAKSSTAECAYLWISTLDTTPLVTLMLSPPVGKPTQTTSSSRAGTLPNSSGQRSSQKVSFATPNYYYKQPLHYVLSESALVNIRWKALGHLMKFTQGRTVVYVYITLRWYFKLEMFMKVQVSSIWKKNKLTWRAVGFEPTTQKTQ